MLVGNKMDLVEKDPSARQVYYDAAAEFARQHGLFFSEASAVTSYNVKQIFEDLFQEIYNQTSKGKGIDHSRRDYSVEPRGGIQLPVYTPDKKGCDQNACWSKHGPFLP